MGRYGGHCFRIVLLSCQLDIQARMLNWQPREEVTSEKRNMEAVCATAGSQQPMSHVGPKHRKLVVKQPLLKIKLYKLIINIFFKSNGNF